MSLLARSTPCAVHFDADFYYLPGGLGVTDGEERAEINNGEWSSCVRAGSAGSSCGSCPLTWLSGEPRRSVLISESTMLCSECLIIAVAVASYDNRGLWTGAVSNCLSSWLVVPLPLSRTGLYWLSPLKCRLGLCPRVGRDPLVPHEMGCFIPEMVLSWLLLHSRECSPLCTIWCCHCFICRHFNVGLTFPAQKGEGLRLLTKNTGCCCAFILLRFLQDQRSPAFCSTTCRCCCLISKMY